MVTNTEAAAMTRTVETMLDELHPLTGERAVLAAMARQLAATLDGMDPGTSARMAGQTHGQLLKVLDKLGGAQPRRHQPAVDTEPTPAEPPTDDQPYEGYEDIIYAEKLSWIFQEHARKTGLPRPGSPAYSQRPWAVDTWQWVAQQKEPRTRPLADLERTTLALVR